MRDSALLLIRDTRHTQELHIGTVTDVAGVAKGLDANTRIVALLDIQIRYVERLMRKTGLARDLAVGHAQGAGRQ